MSHSPQNRLQTKSATKSEGKKALQMTFAYFGQKRGRNVLELEINSEQEKILSADRFMKIVDRYTDIQELTPEIVREFIDKIVVHERSKPCRKKNYTQQVDVFFNFFWQI